MLNSGNYNYNYAPRSSERIKKIYTYISDQEEEKTHILVKTAALDKDMISSESDWRSYVKEKIPFAR